MNLTYKINFAEKILKDPLELYFMSNFLSDKLVSHGLAHHQRVWGYAKELLNFIPEYPADDFIRKLLTACYLHDIGMSVDPGVKHGNHSRKLFEKFLEQNHMQESDFGDVLYAIEHHDDKEYLSAQNEDLLLRILMAADDLDAFGFAGIYRYAEIYLFRGFSTSDIGFKILENVSNRFRNFSSHFAAFPGLIGKHKKRYDILTEFFHVYNNIVDRYDFGGKNPEGPCGVIEIIKNYLSADEKCKLNIIELGISSNDTFIRNFFLRLDNEIS